MKEENEKVLIILAILAVIILVMWRDSSQATAFQSPGSTAARNGNDGNTAGIAQAGGEFLSNRYGEKRPPSLIA
jgi:predicted negative regulator of RcsB-dependent stress response